MQSRNRVIVQVVLVLVVLILHKTVLEVGIDYISQHKKQYKYH